MNMKSGSVLYVQSEDVRIPPASLTKIMTMYIALDAVSGGKASLDDKVRVSKRAASQPGARMNLAEGEEVTLDDLLKGTAVASGNDAAVAVAEQIAGSVEAFRKLMNDKAAELGMTKTVFRNPNGLPSSAQVTTARDMLTLSKSYIENHPDAMRYHNILSITHRGKTTTNKNTLLRMYKHVDGLKTGWTTLSKHHLIATAKSGDVRLVSVVLGAPSSSDLTIGSAFLIEAGFRTVESGGTLKVAAQLEALASGVSLDLPQKAAAVSPDVRAVSPDERPLDEWSPPRLEDELEYEYEEDPGDDIEFDEEEFDDPSVRSEDIGWSDGLPGDKGESRLREIDAKQIIEAVEALCVEANYIIAEDIKDALSRGAEAETDEVSRDVLSQIAENAEISAAGELPLCQDTGMAVVFLEVGQDVHIKGGSIRDAVNEGVRRGYKDGYLRASVVADPVDRVNTGDNTPAIIHFDIVPGDKVRIVVAPKGFGSENMSRLAMLTPSQGVAGIKQFVIDTVKAAGPNPCPPIIVGVGIGGTMEQAALMAKQALLRPIGSTNGSWMWNGLERELLGEINALGIGPAGLGGRTTALAVHIRTFPTHIAGLPIAVNIGCHSTRHVEITL
jgi:fumarate hydratase subunit alpha